MTSMYKELLLLDTQAEYKKIYEDEYCNQDVFTHDGICVKFRRDRFEHAFFTSASRRKRDKSIFSIERAKRIRWIRDVLLDTDITVYSGYDNTKKCYDSTRRVSLVTPDNYVVIISLDQKDPLKAHFISCYLCDSQEVVDKIKSSPLGSISSIVDNMQHVQ